MAHLKTVILLALLTLSTQIIFAQGWERFYSAPVDTFHSGMISADKTLSGDVVILNEGYEHILKIDGNGTPTWIPITDVGGVTYTTWGNPIENFPKGNIIATNDGKFITIDDNAGMHNLYQHNMSGDIYIAKYNVNGDTIWTKKYTGYSNPGVSYLNFSSAMQLSDGNIIIVLRSTTYPILKITLIKINYSDGSKIWTKSFNSNNIAFSPNNIGSQIIENDDGTLMLFSRDLFTNTQAVRKLDSFGNETWKKTFLGYSIYLPFRQRTFSKTADKGYVFLLSQSSWSSPGVATELVKIDSSGTEEWRTPVNVNSNADLIVTSDNHILVSKTKLNPANNEYPSISKYKMDGTLVWEKAKQSQNNHPFLNIQRIVELDNNNFIGVGTTDSSSYFTTKDIYIIKFDSSGNSITNQINGNVYNDQSLNCTQDGNEMNLNTISLLQLVQGTDTSFYTTDLQGNFAIDVATGSYEISAIPPSNYWQACPPQTVNFTNTFDTSTVSLGTQPVTSCSDLVVNISSPRLIRCFSNTYHVNYSNVGTVNESNVYIEIELDPFLIVDSISIPYTQNGNIYTFQIGDLNVFESGSFTIDVTVDCNSMLGQTHCVEANIYPQQICTPTGLWNGATITADAQCTSNNTIELKLENVGLANMTQSKQYWIIEDQVVLLQGSYNLQSGQDSTWTIPANPGSMYRIEAEQEATHPWGNNMPSAFALDCSGSTPNLNAVISQFSLDDYVNFIDIDCQQNIGSYDPNDKQGFPVGYGTQHFIHKEDKIEYLIRFQNTGTAPAINVIIEDEIDVKTLDLTTLQLQGSSHPYTFQIVNGNILQFTFNNIMLPDSNSNEPASHGFIKFKIGQKSTNDDGTLIENDAAIYFDFNAPIITNTTFHTVGINFVRIVSTQEQQQQLATIKIYPNPFTQQATFEITSEKQFNNLQLLVFDVMGRQVKNIQTNGNNHLVLDRGGLITGIYFYKLIGDEQILDSGKLMVR